MSKPKFMVFVSSTYEDLQEERKLVALHLLKAGHIPAGMEFFPADDQSQWDVIKQVIDDCDYYVLIVGNRYGSVKPGSGGNSWTQAEYEYATKRELPVLPFLKDTCFGDTRCDQEEYQGPWQEFIQAILQAHTVSKWSTTDKLCTEIHLSLSNQIDRRPRPGWTRAADGKKDNIVEDDPITDEELRASIESGKSPLKLEFTYSIGYVKSRGRYTGGTMAYKSETSRVSTTLNELLGLLGRSLLTTCSTKDLRELCNSHIDNRERQTLRDHHPEAKTVSNIKVSGQDFDQFLLKLRKLGWIDVDASLMKRDSKDQAWALTGLGRAALDRLSAEDD